jgi:tRNA nucleotidyltransferase/poly(A) polymerase
MAARRHGNVPAPGLISGRVVRALRRRKALWKFLDAFCRAVEKRGGKPYLVGGFVRDLVEGRPGKDIDLMVAGMAFGELGILLRSLPANALGIRRILPAGKAFPVYKLRAGWAEEEVDVAPARTERPADRGRGDFDPCAQDAGAREDASRRDFTSNSIMVALRTEKGRLTGTVVDFFGGLADMKKRLIRGVGNPDDRFREDPLRILRAIRQKNERPGYAIERRTWAALRRAAPEHLPGIPGERIAAEMVRSLSSNPGGTVEDLRRAGILRRILPGVPLGARRPDRMLRRYAILEKSLGRPLPETPLLANLLADLAVAECAERIRNASRGKPPGWKPSKSDPLFRLPRTEAAARRLHLPGMRTVTRMLEDLARLLNHRLLKHPNARIEAVFHRWKTPVHLLSFYEAVCRAGGAIAIDFRPLLEIAAGRPPLLSGRDLLRMGIPASPGMDAILEEVREVTLTGGIKTRKEAADLARSICRATKAYALPGKGVR